MKKSRFEKYKHKGKINGGILGQIKNMGTIGYSSTIGLVTLEDIKQAIKQLEKITPPKIYWSEPICVGDKMYFNGPDIYGSCSVKLWREALLKKGNNK